MYFLVLIPPSVPVFLPSKASDDRVCKCMSKCFLLTMLSLSVSTCENELTHTNRIQTLRQTVFGLMVLLSLPNLNKKTQVINFTWVKNACFCFINLLPVI